MLLQVFVQLVPHPKPRASSLTEEQRQRAGRTDRRQERKGIAEGVSLGAAAEGGDSESDLPDFSIGEKVMNDLHHEPCIWDQPIERDLQVRYRCCCLSDCSDSVFQVEMLLTLQRLMEHFAAAAFSIQQTRSFDAVCVCVPGCIAAIADSLMRRCATDYVSQVPYLQLPALLWLRIHLAGLLASNGPDTRRQTIGCGWLWSQCRNFRRTD